MRTDPQALSPFDPHSDPVLVLGIGNLLWADEGFGVRCAETLGRTHVLPGTVTLMDGGTQGLYLLPHVTAARRMVLFDAVDYGLPPGSVHVVEDGDIPRFTGAKKMSLHQTGFQEVLAAATLLGRLPEKMVLIGVQPVDMSDYGGPLHDTLKARVPEAVALGVARLRDWGLSVGVRAGEVSADLFDPSLAHEPFEAGRPSADEACRFGDTRVLARMSPCSGRGPGPSPGAGVGAKYDDRAPHTRERI
ncbi:HyaD/HybD family hydrogenase maturation endopeptidase [Phaeovibrio sulfidiphilus]|uniref:Hydrogenase expression/formation protein HupD n=1 Tax=Phaeovibrio sulfidiphilus TaxID=1220600 RepID=A0A8J6YNB6_9PROT|nr:HyaD/HybD family hydrogenase maturation endopeptidase [Phaeovibrio sulfidiphilus]MBE1236491.1 HyaD/HybD family hydrogenase maturation endopeptidase [Phaeovibrio sulfidiphilus]